jgi:DNA-binding transcriptional MerR regulator
VVSKSPDAFRTISEVAEDLDLPQHVLRFWETRFTQIRPMKRGGGRRYYRPDDVELLRGIRHLLYGEGYTIRGVQRILREQGPRFVVGAGRGEATDLPEREPADEVEDDVEGAMPQTSPPPMIRAAPRSTHMDEVEPDDREPEGIAPPVMVTPHRAPPVRPVAPASPVPVRGLSRDDSGRLQATLAELLECKRLLDQAR